MSDPIRIVQIEDDDRDVLRVLIDLPVGNRRISLTTYSTPDTFREDLRRGIVAPPDIALIDLVIGNDTRGGVGILEAIEREPRWSDVVRVLFTQFSKDYSEAEWQGLGGHAVLQKSYDLSQPNKVLSLLEQIPAVREKMSLPGDQLRLIEARSAAVWKGRTRMFVERDFQFLKLLTVDFYGGFMSAEAFAEAAGIVPGSASEVLKKAKFVVVKQLGLDTVTMEQYNASPDTCEGIMNVRNQGYMWLPNTSEAKGRIRYEPSDR